MTNLRFGSDQPSISGGQVLPEQQELSERGKTRKESPMDMAPAHAPAIQPKESIVLSGVFRSYANSRGSFHPGAAKH